VGQFADYLTILGAFRSRWFGPLVREVNGRFAPVYFDQQAKARGEKRWRLSMEANRLLEEMKEGAIIFADFHPAAYLKKFLGIEKKADRALPLNYRIQFDLSDRYVLTRERHRGVFAREIHHSDLCPCTIGYVH
jgi:hypothetical protein